MAYGSWSGGIFVLQIDKTTGKAIYPGQDTGSPFTDRYFGTKIAGGYGKSGEGPFVVYDKDTGYYYLYVTYGGLNATGGYNMRMFRSVKPDGPYVDASGKNAVLPSNTDNSPYGIKLMGNYKFSSISSGYRSPGHNSSFIDSDGQMYLLYHTRFDNGTEYHEVRVHQMFINEDGWPVVAPYENNGDAISPTGYGMDEIAGTYEFINHGTSNSGASMLPTLQVNLNKDYTITGDITGTWSMTNGSYYMKIVYNGITYKGVFFKQNDESKYDSKVMTFSAVGSNNQVIWGSKYIDDRIAVQIAANNLRDKIPGTVRGDIALSAAGDYGTTITWSSSNKYLLAPTGAVNRLDEDVPVTLTARVTKGTASAEQSFSTTVKGKSYALNEKPIYQYDFESVNNSAVVNNGSKLGNATLSGTASIAKDGQRGNVLQLANSANAIKANYLALPADTFDGMTEDGFTVGMWVNADTLSPNYWPHSALFEANAGGQNAYPVTRISANLFGRINSNGAWADATAISKSLTGNTWQYVTYTVNSQGIAVYLDGIKVGTAHTDLTQSFSNNSLSAAKDVRVGSGNIWGDADIASAKFDNVAVFNRALTEDEVDALYNKESLNFVLDKSGLVKALLSASNELDSDVEGDKASLQAAITAAETVLTSTAITSQKDIDAAVIALNTAIENFREISIVTITVDNTAVAKTKTVNLSLTAKDQFGVIIGLRDAKIEYFSSNPQIVSVQDGVITANEIGSAEITIYVTTQTGRVIKSNTIAVQVLPILEKVMVMSDKSFLKAGATAQLSIEGVMTDGTQADLSKAQITYTSDNKQIAAVDHNGIVTPVSEGPVYIKVSVSLDDITREESVELVMDYTPPAITVTGLVYGTLSDAGDMTPTIALSDDLSGVDTSKTKVTLDSYEDQLGTTIPLYTLPLGSHTLIVTATDLAGNTGSKAVSFQTTTSIESLQALITRFANAGWIDNAGIANSLQKKLAANNLDGFASEVKAQNGKHILSQAANYLLRDA